ncbi:MAG TPA: DNA-formamidopyrimidine glycosylase family protein [Candidatus Baltobacteraceae bacterium]|nr:DNA-formamidopyrimidine glycosylase family protein [Candidatus Baltobacteraceae bacterium]
MPEGDTIYRTAVVLRRVLQGKKLTSVSGSLAATESSRGALVGRVVEEVNARGKHLLIRLRNTRKEPSEDLVLHTHLGMHGSWHAYQIGVPWKKPRRLAQVILTVKDAEAAVFTAPVVELLTTRQVARHPTLTSLGPDASAEHFDAPEVLKRLRSRPDLSIAEGLLLQRAMAGVGNVFKSEVLFVERVNPFAKIGDLSDDTLARLIAQSRILLVINRQAISRRTRGSLDPDGRLWVYDRIGLPCRTCGSAIRMRRHGAGLRSTYFCPQCQQVETA